ncbi:MAG: hypothetical protein U1F66_05840 [bacterium]
MKIGMLPTIFFVLALSCLAPDLRAAGSAAPASGVYGELTLGYDPQSQTLSGYYQNGTGQDASGQGPLFSCIFALLGKRQGEGFAVQTWFPGEGKAQQVISGRLQFLAGAGAEPGSVRLKLDEEPGGCGMVDPDLAKAEGSQRTLDTPGSWTAVRVVSAKRAHFYGSPEAVAPRKTYVVRGDGLRVWEQKPGWVLAEFEGRNRGWIQEKDLFPTRP